jgi:hypothetical protein
MRIGKTLWISVEDSIRQTIAIYVNQHREFAISVHWAVFPIRILLPPVSLYF